MRRVKQSDNFIIWLLLNMLFNFEWSIPAWILLGMHFWLDWPIWLFWSALALWALVIIIWMKLLGFAADFNMPDPPKENKNPYSSGKYPDEK